MWMVLALVGCGPLGESGSSSTTEWGIEEFECQPQSNGPAAEFVLGGQPLIAEFWECSDAGCDSIQGTAPDPNDKYYYGCGSEENTIQVRWMDPR